MFTDMVGYSALSQRNEALALELLEEHRQIVRAAISRHRGREVKTMGDGFLLEFPSALAAVQGAVDLQQTLRERNELAPGERKIQLRVGVHVGDVVARGRDIHGDGVNIAARLEPLAPAGGICVSEDVERQIRNKLPQAVAPLGRSELKNISLPVAVFRIVLPWEKSAMPTSKPPPGRPGRLALIIAATTLALGLLLLIWKPWRQRTSVTDTTPSVGPTPTVTVNVPTDLKVSDNSVAVLAFANLSDDKGNEYFSDGISEELLDALSKVPGLKVTARTSSFHFKGRDTPIPEIARQLGVAYVVEGSVRKSGDKVRITAQLVKAVDGFHVWSDTFTRELKDVFAVQDEIAGLVAKSLSLKLGTETPAAAVSPEVFRLYLEGRQEWNRRNKESLAKAEELFAQAVALDPSFARAHAGLADVWMIRADQLENGNEDATTEWIKTSEYLDRALRQDPELPEAHATRGNYLAHKGRIAEAEQAYQRALALNPSYASAHQWYGRLLFDRGQLGAGLAELELATRLDPLSPIITSNYGMYLAYARRWKESLAVTDRALAIQPDSPLGINVRAWVLTQLDRQPEALALLRASYPSLGQNAPADADANGVLIKLLALAGDRANAERLAAPILADPGPHSSPNEIFELFLTFDRIDEAFAYQEKLGYGFKRSDVKYFMDPIYDRVRDDPRFLRKLDEGGVLATYQEEWAQYLEWKKNAGQLK